MRINPIDEAVNEQLQGFVPEPGIEKGIKRRRLRRMQTWQKRRHIETILIEMTDKLRAYEQPKKKRRKRRCRRGPRVLVADLTE